MNLGMDKFRCRNQI